jgi:hypothetical protein
MNASKCEHALLLAEQDVLSGEVLAARWHVQQCPHCQAFLTTLQTQITHIHDRLAIQQLLDIDLEDALVQQTGGVLTWIERQTQRIIAVVTQLTDSIRSGGPQVQLMTLSPDDPNPPHPAPIIGHTQAGTEDGLIKWEISFLLSSSMPDQCASQVRVHLLDRWDLTGINVFLFWDHERLQGATDERGFVQFLNIPRNVIGQIQVLIVPPYCLR